jgi:hypothetical protein
MRSLLLILCCTSTAFAELPVVDIQGPTVANVGQPLILDARQSVGDHFSWKAVPAETSPGIPSIEVIEEGRRCVVTTMPGKYHIIVAVATSEGVVQKLHTVEVVWGNVKPELDKEDKVTPKPPEPIFEERLGVETKVRDWLSTVPIGRRGKQATLSLAFKEAAQRATQISDLKKVEGESRSNLSSDLVREALGTEAANWSTFFNSLGIELAQLEVDGKLNTLDDFKQAWLEISEGLK